MSRHTSVVDDVFDILQQCNGVQFANSATLIWTLWKQKKIWCKSTIEVVSY